MDDATGSAPHTEQRRLAAIMFTDIVGFSRQMGADEARMLRLRDFLHLGHAYYLAGRSETAIAALKKSLNGSPADLDAHLLLAAVYSELGKDAEAQAEAAEVLRINPNWSLEVWKQRVPYKDPATLDRVYTALRKAELR